MRNSIGWRSVLPWALGMLSLVVLAHVVIAWAIESKVVRSGQRSVGARVEVAQATVPDLNGDTSCSDGRLHF